VRVRLPLVPRSPAPAATPPRRAGTLTLANAEPTGAAIRHPPSAAGSAPGGGNGAAARLGGEPVLPICDHMLTFRSTAGWTWQTPIVQRERAVGLVEHVLRNLHDGQQDWPLSLVTFGGAEWVEIVHPTRTMPLDCLRIVPLDREALGQAAWD
jgi:hypothetical protein